MKRTLIIGVAVVLSGAFQSCLKEKECPPPAGDSGLFVSVAEKNYDNVGQIPQAVPIDENLAFRSYVEVIDVRYQPVGNPLGIPVQRTLLPDGDSKQASLPTDIPDGSYQVLATGNADPVNFAAGQEYLLELHPGGLESGDTYLAQGTVNFPLDADRTLSMKRTKGLLLLYYESLPMQIRRISLQADGVSKNTDSRLAYSGLITVVKDYQLPTIAGPGVLTLLLAPTDGNPSPKLTIHLSDDNGNSVAILSNIALPITRNRITALELSYDPIGGWELWISVEGVWVQIHQLTIDQ